MGELVPDRSRPHAWIVRTGGIDQSYVDVDDPTHLEFDYVQRIADVIDTGFPPDERITALHIGGAGMTIPRYIAHTRPTSAQIVFEPDALMTQAIREVAPLGRNSGIKVREIDGRAGIADISDDYADLVVIDAFADARTPAKNRTNTDSWGGPCVPADLITLEWFEQVRRVLHKNGTVVMNLTDIAPFMYSRRVITGISSYFSPVVVGAEPSTWKGRRLGNLVVSAGGEIDPHILVRRASSAVFPYRLLYDIELKQWLGKVPAYTDEDAEPSPPIVEGPTVFR
ncbi:MAG: fused MFS/spermidine synthase [Propionibacteriaceae bacterium]|nr:fused MFS/spermidine synthase [Propionibacteriaceae bacterium]